MRNPRAAHVLKTECFRVARYALHVIAVAIVREVATDGFEAAGGEHGFEFFWRIRVGARGFDVSEPEALHSVECRCDVVGEVRAQAVKLKANRSFETRTYADRRFPR